MSQYTADIPLGILFLTDVSAGTSITPPAPTATEPTGDGIYDWRLKIPQPSLPGGNVGNILKMIFYGTGGNNKTGTARVTAWTKIGVGTTNTLWIPIPLMALAFTLGQQTGAANTPIAATYTFADVITASTAFTTANEIISPGGTDGAIACCKVDAFGAEKIQVQLALGVSSGATLVNCAIGNF